MEKNDFTKVITLEKTDMTGEYWRGSIYDLKYYFVRADIRNTMRPYIDLGYSVVFKRKRKIALMLYNK